MGDGRQKRNSAKTQFRRVMSRIASIPGFDFVHRSPREMRRLRNLHAPQKPKERRQTIVGGVLRFSDEVDADRAKCAAARRGEKRARDETADETAAKRYKQAPATSAATTSQPAQKVQGAE